jgi:5-carboxymethyl-2-hydroxymuconate isomerase
MPHIQIEYSPNLESRLDMLALCRLLCRTAAGTRVFPPAGIRVRAMACDHVCIADGNPDHAFIDISVRLRGGRTAEQKKAATDAIFAAAESHCADYMARASLMLSLEMRDIDPELSPKASSIRQYLAEDMR